MLNFVSDRNDKPTKSENTYIARVLIAVDIRLKHHRVKIGNKLRELAVVETKLGNQNMVVYIDRTVSVYTALRYLASLGSFLKF